MVPTWTATSVSCTRLSLVCTEHQSSSEAQTCTVRYRYRLQTVIQERGNLWCPGTGAVLVLDVLRM